MNYPESDTQRFLVEFASEAAVRAEVDVLVIGGGLGGVAAALAAARAGARTMLIERHGYPGGSATVGSACSIFNCFYTPSGRLGVTGIPVEIAEAFAETSGVGSDWHAHKGHIVYDVEAAKLKLATLLDEAGVTCLFNTVATGAVLDGDRVRGAFIHSKSGREAVLGRVVVDATGDCDVVGLADGPLNEARGAHQHHYGFRLGNVDLDCFVHYFKENPEQYPAHIDVDWTSEEALDQYVQTGTFVFPHGGGFQLDLFKRAITSGELPQTVGVKEALTGCQIHGIRKTSTVQVITGTVALEQLDIATMSQAMIDGKRMAYVLTDFFRKKLPGFARANVIGLADELGLRSTRWLDNEFVFTAEMKQTATRFDDAIARGVVQRDVKKHPAEDAWSAHTLSEGAFDIPFRVLIPDGIEGVIVGAGRAVSAESPILLKTMALTMAVGQGAGVAAAVAAAQRVPVREAPMPIVQNELRRQHVQLGQLAHTV